tara:strand:- start:147 stop:386 length:240 start_codon:yes stop_codon:yes gene_type:complete
MRQLETRIRFCEKVIAVNREGTSWLTTSDQGVVEIKETTTFTEEGEMINIEVEGIDIDGNTVRAMYNLPMDITYIKPKP